MAGRKRRELSPAELEKAKANAGEKRQQAKALMARAPEAFKDPGTWARFLAGPALLLKPDGTPYSLRNQMLIMMQCPHASDVAGYGDWQARGRQVRKGETGYLVRAPVTRRRGEDDGSENGEGGPRAMCGVTVRKVFDISQTDPVPGKPFKPVPNPRLRTLAEVAAAVREFTGDDAGPILAAMDAARDAYHATPRPAEAPAAEVPAEPAPEQEAAPAPPEIAAPAASDDEWCRECLADLPGPGQPCPSCAPMLATV